MILVPRVCLLATLVPLIAAAEPAITGVTGTISSGQTLTITGSGFGSKSPVAPLKFDNFENGVAGDLLKDHDALWHAYEMDLSGLAYSNADSHSGGIALGRHNTDGENFTTNYFTYAPASQELFVSYWWKVVPINPGNTVIKMTRLNSSAAAGGGGVYNGPGNTSLGGTYDLQTATGPYCAYNDGINTEMPITGNWGTSTFNAPPNSTWIKIDSYKKLSTAGVADGCIDYRVNNQEKFDNAAITRAAGKSFQLDTVLLGTMDGSAQAHDYWVYVDDVYIDTTRAHVEICESAQWATRTHGEMQLPHTQWNDGQLQITVNQGSFASGASLYLYVVNSDGVANANGFPITLGGSGPGPGNHPPVATAQSVSTAEDTAKAITLAATDADGDALTYAIASTPTHGTLSGSGASRTYTPAANYNGSDSFTFTANDGTATSAAATVTITVTAVNDAPVATAQSVSTAEDTVKLITLAGTDVDGNTLTYAIASNPAHGTASLSGTTVSYTPSANYNGGDSFTFTASDGTVTSAAAAVTITVTAVNDAPVATAQDVNATKNTAQAITLAGTDVEGSPLSYAIALNPTHGSLSGSGANQTYTPAVDYTGSDSFTFTVSDGVLTSPAATVTIAVSAGGSGGTPQSSSGSGGGCGVGGMAGLIAGLCLMLGLRRRR